MQLNETIAPPLAHLGIFTAAGGNPPPRRPRRMPLPHEQHFHHAVDLLIEVNMRLRSELRHYSSQSAPGRYAQDFCTVRANAGRSAGASSYIASHATERDLVIVASAKIRDHSYRRPDMPCPVVTPDQLVRNPHGMYRRAERHDRIFIDSPSFIFDQVCADELYNRLAHDPEQTFILLGA